jgi:hypothetical protein
LIQGDRSSLEGGLIIAVIKARSIVLSEQPLNQRSVKHMHPPLSLEFLTVIKACYEKIDFLMISHTKL